MVAVLPDFTKVKIKCTFPQPHLSGNWTSRNYKSLVKNHVRNSQESSTNYWCKKKIEKSRLVGESREVTYIKINLNSKTIIKFLYFYFLFIFLLKIMFVVNVKNWRQT